MVNIILSSFQIIFKFLVILRFCFLMRYNFIILVCRISKLIWRSYYNWSLRIYRISLMVSWLLYFCWIKQNWILDHSWIYSGYFSILLFFIWPLSAFWFSRQNLAVFSTWIFWFVEKTIVNFCSLIEICNCWLKCGRA